MIPFGHHLSDADLPAGWRTVPLKHLTVELQRGAAPDYVDDSTLRVIGQPCVRRGHVDLSRARHTAEVADPRRQRGYLHDGDVLITSTGAGTLGRAALFTGDGGDYVADGHVTYLHPRRDRVDPRYLAYVLGLEAADRYMNEVLAVGATKQTELNREPLAALPVAVPPLEEQRRISNLLDDALSTLDALARKNLELYDIVRARFWSLVEYMLTERGSRSVGKHPLLGDLPSEWPVVSMRRVVTGITDGPFGSNLTSEHYREKGARVVRLGNIGRSRFLAHDEAYISLEHFQHLQAHEARAGDLIVAGLGDEATPAGRAVVLPEELGPAIVKADCYRVRLDQHRLLHVYAAWWLSSNLGIAVTAMSAKGVTRPRINLGLFKDLPVPLPPLTYQKQAVAEIDDAALRTERLHRRLDRELRALAERQQALITAAVTGRLDVTTASTTRTTTTAAPTAEAVA